MQNKQEGILVRLYMPERNRISLFDAQSGRLEAFIPARQRHALRAAQGTLIEYRLSSWREYTFIEEIAVVAYPVPMLQEDIHFLHHLLELVFFFVPHAEQMPELFALLEWLYRSDEHRIFETRFTRQLFLCRFFSLLGIYPGESMYQHAVHVRRLILSPLETMVRDADERTMSSLVQSWVLACIHSHPQIALFKTVGLWRSDV